MTIKRCFYFLILLCFTVNVCSAQVRGEYIYNNPESLLEINRGIGVLVDTSKSLTIDEVVDKDFVFKETKIPSFGITVDRIWIKVDIWNKTNEKELFLLIAEPSIDQIQMFVEDEIGRWNTVSLGSYKNYRNRFINIPDYALPVSIPFNTLKTFYISVESKDQMQVPLYLGTERAVSGFALNKSLIFGLYIGIIIIMAIYHFFIYFSVEKVSYLFYILFIVSVGLVQMDFQGYAFKFLWPNSPWVASNSSFLVPMLSGLSTAFFVKRFLYTKFFTPKLHVGINVYMVLCVFAATIGLIGYEFLGVQLLQIIALIGAIYAMYISFVIIKKDYRPAKFFLLAFAIFFVSVIIFVLRNFNIIPYTLFTSYILEIGSAIQIVLLSFALADEINSYRKAKESSQTHAFEVLKENDRIIKEQNIILEKEVNLRTAALSESNDNLQKVIVDLKQAQTKLVEAEKLASLGMLTAGIAHEINNPINFVTSNVNPLRRDINQIFEALTEYERIGLSSSELNEKKEEIERIKVDLELDYLKDEVKFLLAGIEDGAKRTAGIVKSLRVFSRVDEDDLKLADINLGIGSTLVILNSLFDDNMKVETNLGELPLIDCYPGKLNQVFLNLLSNASYALKKKFGNKPGGVLQVITRFDGDYINIHVKDNGSGMSEEVKSKIFEPFYTTKDVGEGTGLGLSIAYQTILQHQGEIIINSNPDQGAEFIIKLPLVRDDVSNA